ncbi:MAG: fatty acid oxidation complex subunit alpha FadJ [Acidobacteriota bacterium]
MSLTQLERAGDLAVVWLDQAGEKINKISVDLLDEFRQLLDDLERDEQIRGAILISRKKDNFIAGADIEKFLEITQPGQAEELSRQGNALLSRMARSSKPIVAAIHGAALGGGLEVALACHYRIVSDSPKTVLGLPEVKLGLLPGGGGTQRLPRLIGLQRGLNLLLTGKNVYPYPARRMGLADLVVHPSGLLETAKKVARELAANGTGRRKRPRSRGWLEANPLTRKLIFRKARQRVLQQTKGRYPAPLKILECVETGLSRGMAAGLEREAKNFGFLMGTPECGQLIRLFFSITAARKNPLQKQVRGVRRMAVLGAGLMGSGIADVSANKGIEVFLKDVSQEAVGKAEKTIWDGLSRRVRKRAITPFDRDRIFSRIHGVTDYEGFRKLDLVVEAVFEELELKREILKQAEAAAGEETIFASNTSSLPISQIAAVSSRPQQVIGMHYFSPVQKMPLLEIIRTDQTADWVTATAIDVGTRQGKTVIVVGDGPGFYTTRILSPLMNEALTLLAEGARIEAIDQAMRRFGFPVGPVTLMDEVGIDVGAHVGRVLAPLFEARGARPKNKAEELFKAGYSGRKNQKGFYLYKGGKKKKVNSEIYSYFGGARRKTIAASEIQQRLALTMVNEAALCLQEGILSTPRDGDLGAILGLGFPPFLGGPFRYVDSLGADKVLARLQELEQKHEARFTPAPILKEQASSHRSFYSD